MIRKFQNEDKEKLIKILKQGIAIVGQNSIDFINEADRIIIYDEHETGVLGFSSLMRWGPDKLNGKIVIYVVPNSRKKGIGTLLYSEIMKYADECNLNLIDTEFRVDKDDATLFYKKLGYKKWFGLHEMHYNGSEQPKSDMNFVSYEDKYFEQYIEGLRNSFYEMRRVHDFQPHLCCEFSQKKRDELLSSKDNIFLLLVNGDFVASASVKVDDKDSLGPIFVVPSYQGKRYGRIITQFAINEAINRNINNINLEVVEWNKRAVNLYISLGFDIIQTTHTYRRSRA
jgi:ribosomal protein S18 acetylase RimI-like enzyme